MQHYTRVAIALALGAGPGLVKAESTEARLDEVVVTATKTEKDTADAPATVSIVNARDIEAMNVQSADEALTTLPGVYTTRPGGHQPSVMGTNTLLRGLPDYSRTLVLVDGQTLNDPYIGAVTWESVPPETIERIEVVPGPFSSLYGGSAMGGVINIITKKPTKREVTAKAGYGTDQFRSGTLVYQDRTDGGVGVVFDLAYKAADGYIKDEVVRTATDGTTGTPVTGWTATTDPYGDSRYLIGDKGRSPWESINAGAKFHVDVSEDARISLSASHFKYEKQWDRFNTYLRDAAGNPVSAGAVTFNDAGTDKTMTVSESSFLSGPNPKEQNRFAFEYDYDLGGGAAFKAQLGYLDTPIYDYTIPKAGATYDGGGPGSRLHRPNSEASSTFQLSFPAGERHFMVAGVSAGRREIETYQYAIDDWRDADATGTTENQTAGEDQTYALFIQDEITLGERLTAYLGGRYDWWSTEGYIEQVKAPAYRNDYDERSQSYFSPKASLVYRPQPQTTLRASAGQAFHPPMLRDTFGWWTPATGLTYEPNPDLEPETVTSWELGLEQRFGAGWLFRATYYENYLHDLIYRTQTATTETITNAAKAEIKGVEVELRKQLTPQVQAFVNATYNDAKITENSAKPETEGKRMTRTPQKMANAGINGKRGPFSASLFGHYVGKVYANDENLDVINNVYGSYDPYFIMNTKAAYQVTKSASVSIAIDNLLDREYYEGTRAQGRAYYGEVTWRF